MTDSNAGQGYERVPTWDPAIDAQLDQVQNELKAIIQNLYNLIVQTTNHEGSPTQMAMKREITSLVENLISLSNTAPKATVTIPPELITYVENTRNPRIYTREFVELVQRMNQTLKGRSEAFAQMRDILARDIMAAIPDTKGDVKKVVESTGGKIDT
ncbi:RNA polymeras-like protein II mediator complex subunit 10 [Delitschia confertaspora ATCC 74209]|uniref:Mediator of RNA polymerase II transcription subunit 10 n=1 Tax=Delitschia confertaspora ATCC 74209 TaxID=1513339 RepID=A0A9P4JH09_9PLEO|nr:RNA polymeras-like protein II mediator complex subunit 10 [Delitschia confertaspora ATCC 74209]